MTEGRPADSRVFTWTSGSEVQPVRVDWWETHLIPRGVLTVPAGRGNAGKSTACAAWAAEATRRGETVAWLHSEEDRAMHITPKLLAAGADLDLIKFLDVGVLMEDGTISEASLQLPRDIDRLEEGLVDMGCCFVVFDALTSFKSSRMSANSGDDVRAFLEPIQRMAGRLNAVVLGIAHLGKDGERKARDAVKGASEWTDVPRQVLAFHRDDGETEGVISDVKGNLSPSPRSIGYRFENVALPEHGIDEVGRIVFTGDVDTTVDDARRASTPDDDGDDRRAALRWVEDYLGENGETDAAVVKKACAKELCISVRTVERGTRLNGSRVVSEARGFPRKAYWRLVDVIDGEVVSGDTGGSSDSDDSPVSTDLVATDAAVATEPDQAKRDVATAVATDENRSSDKPENSVVIGDDASATCPHCADPLVFDDDRRDGYHTSIAACVRAHKKADLHVVSDNPKPNRKTLMNTPCSGCFVSGVPLDADGLCENCGDPAAQRRLVADLVRQGKLTVPPKTSKGQSA
ncbi:AAA family ATPase [Gordonia sp. i37]|uniref:AAA family ATPase n=1 Tax=Gordonia sp. i37 TaxID=1961707 RepID=UPI0009AE755E|nr:AAA family ATPase [Gordonia sp. i37]